MPREDRLTYKGYYLIEPEANSKSPCYLIAWYDAKSGQRRTRTTGVENVSPESKDQAHLKLIKYANAHPLLVRQAAAAEASLARQFANTKPLTDEEVKVLAQEAADSVEAQPDWAKREPVDDLPLSAVMMQYLALRTYIKNKGRVVSALADFQEVFGKNVTCRQLTGAAQHTFVANRRALIDPTTGLRQQTDWTILTRMKSAWAAMNDAVEMNTLKRKAVPRRLSARKWKPKAFLKKRKVTLPLESIAKLIMVAWQNPERWLPFILQGIEYCCRPMGALDAEPRNYDPESETVSLLAYGENGEQVEESDKRRAIVKLSPTMQRWLKFWCAKKRQAPQWHDPQFVTYMGHRMVTFDFFMVIAKRAGVTIPRGLGAYILRKFAASQLAKRKVKREERRVRLGHDIDQDPVSSGYVHLEPDYQAEAAAALEQMWHEIDAFLPPEMTILVPHDAVGELVSGDADTEAAALYVPGKRPQDRVMHLDPVREDQAEPGRYATWFWEQFQGAAFRLHPGPWHERGTRRTNQHSKQEVTETVAVPDKDPPSE